MNHFMAHEYIFLDLDDGREIVLKKNRGQGDGPYNYIGELEDCGDSMQLHTHEDDVIVVGRWWSKKRIGCINGEVGWVCRDIDFITHNVGRVLFAPLDLAICTAFAAIGDPVIDEKIKGLTNEELTAFITGPPYPPVSKKVQRIFFGEVRDDSAPEETAADDGTDGDDPDDDCANSSSNSDYDSYSGSDYSPSTSCSNASASASKSPSNGLPTFWILLAIVLVAFLVLGRSTGFIKNDSSNSSSVLGGTRDTVDSTAVRKNTSGSNQESIANAPIKPRQRLDDAKPATPIHTPNSKLSPLPQSVSVPPTPLPGTKRNSDSGHDRGLIDMEKRAADAEQQLIQREKQRRKDNIVSPEQSRRAEAAGRDAMGRSPFERSTPSR